MCIRDSYRPQFYFRTTDVTGVCELPAGTEMCMPGDNVEMTIELIHPVAMEPVSYTHLDVYKRQGVQSRRITKTQRQRTPMQKMQNRKKIYPL